MGDMSHWTAAALWPSSQSGPTLQRHVGDLSCRGESPLLTQHTALHRAALLEPTALMAHATCHRPEIPAGFKHTLRSVAVLCQCIEPCMAPLCCTPGVSHTAEHGCSCALCVQLVEPLELTLAQLKEYDGCDKKKPIYLAIRGVVFNVSRGEATQPLRLAGAAWQLQNTLAI